MKAPLQASEFPICRGRPGGSPGANAIAPALPAAKVAFAAILRGFASFRRVPDRPAAAARNLGNPPVFRFHRALELRDAVILMQDRGCAPVGGPDEPVRAGRIGRRRPEAPGGDVDVVLAELGRD